MRVRSIARCARGCRRDCHRRAVPGAVRCVAFGVAGQPVSASALAAELRVPPDSGALVAVRDKRRVGVAGPLAEFRAVAGSGDLRVARSAQPSIAAVRVPCAVLLVRPGQLVRPSVLAALPGKDDLRRGFQSSGCSSAADGWRPDLRRQQYDDCLAVKCRAEIPPPGAAYRLAPAAG